MELDWSTFILEIINFLVLVWILQRFLYRPVMNVVTQRRATIAKSLDEAQTTQNTATALKEQYENRLNDWQQEREEARRKLHDEIEAQRQQLLTQLQAELAEQRQKEQVLAARRSDTLLREAQQQAMDLSTQFSAKFLSRFADTTLQDKLLTMLLEDLGALPDAQRQTLADAQQATGTALQIISAFPLNEHQRQTLCTALQKVTSSQASCEFSEDSALLSGISVHIGSQRLQANLQEELSFFHEQLHHET